MFLISIYYSQCSLTNSHCKVFNRVDGLKHPPVSSLSAVRDWKPGWRFLKQGCRTAWFLSHDKQCCNACNCSQLNSWAFKTVRLSGGGTVTDTSQPPRYFLWGLFIFVDSCGGLGKLSRIAVPVAGNSFLTVQGAGPERLAWRHLYNMVSAVLWLLYSR